MKIFFNASIAGKKEHLKDYKMIIRAIQELGHEILYKHVTEEECVTNDVKLRGKYRRYTTEIKKLLSKSDVMVAESSYPSISVGYLLSVSLALHKPTLILYQHNPHRILVGDSSRFLSLRKYKRNSYSKLVTTLHHFIKHAKKKTLRSRFNLMLDETMNSLLERKSKKSHMSKADLIRRLIEKNVEDEL